MKVTAWKNAKHASGTIYGFRVSRADREKYFSKDWTCVSIELPDDSIAQVKITDGFWRKCTELRSPDIREWLYQTENAPWEYGDTPKFEMRPAGKPKESNRFKIIV